MKKTVVGLGAGPVLAGDAHRTVAPGLALRREPSRASRLTPSAATSRSPTPTHSDN